MKWKRVAEEEHPASRKVMRLIRECRGAWNHYFALSCKKDDAAARGDAEAIERYDLALKKVDESLMDSERRLANADKEEQRDVSKDWREQSWAKLSAHGKGSTHG